MNGARRHKYKESYSSYIVCLICFLVINGNTKKPVNKAEAELFRYERFCIFLMYGTLTIRLFYLYVAENSVAKLFPLLRNKFALESAASKTVAYVITCPHYTLGRTLSTYAFLLLPTFVQNRGQLVLFDCAIFLCPRPRPNGVHCCFGRLFVVLINFDAQTNLSK